MTDATERTPRKNPTIYDVAKLAGVSKSLVTLVLRDDPLVRPAKREAVLQAIADLNYRPSLAARQMGAGRTRTIGMMVSNYSNTLNVRVLEGVREVLDSAGFRLIMSDAHRTSLHEDPIAVFASMRVEGMIYVTAPHDVDASLLSVPTVLIGIKDQSGIKADEIFSDNYAGSVLALDHLWNLGHRDIAHFTGEGEIAQMRRHAYEQYMTIRGQAPMVFGEHLPTDADGGYTAARHLMQSDKPFSAIYAANDRIATGAKTAFAEIGLHVPDDVSLVGYDDTSWAAPSVSNLTTVDDRAADIGRLSAERLLDQINATTPHAPIQRFLEPRLVVRASTREHTPA